MVVRAKCPQCGVSAAIPNGRDSRGNKKYVCYECFEEFTEHSDEYDYDTDDYLDESEKEEE